MPPTIDVSDATFGRLQKYATPLIDSGDSTVAKVLDMLEGTVVRAPAQRPITSTIDPSGPIDLTYTKVTGAKVCGKSLPRSQCYWNSIMLAAIHEAAKQLPAGREIGDLIVVNHVPGRKEVHGYKYQEDLGLSIQGQDSNYAWKAVVHLARETGITAEVDFVWYDNPKAFRPGASGQLTV